MCIRDRRQRPRRQAPTPQAEPGAAATGVTHSQDSAAGAALAPGATHEQPGREPEAAGAPEQDQEHQEEDHAEHQEQRRPVQQEALVATQQQRGQEVSGLLLTAGLGHEAEQGGKEALVPGPVTGRTGGLYREEKVVDGKKTVYKVQKSKDNAQKEFLQVISRYDAKDHQLVPVFVHRFQSPSQAEEAAKVLCQLAAQGLSKQQLFAKREEFYASHAPQTGETPQTHEHPQMPQEHLCQ